MDISPLLTLTGLTSLSLLPLLTLRLTDLRPNIRNMTKLLASLTAGCIIVETSSL